ncbi:fimbrial protein [Scandinavium lactucae]|uniref:Fimbrial protein n=1 Tax=Scandinavium lactucae TaxID=3095028 RepID=A0ABU4QLZ7_9ENTR|nr:MULTISPECIES: fimbrial protein [unclassified Scandinavium]MDX6040271.1 fimbrial protein [Scandinavium sp. V105_6]MDX6051058.1 fimbrial protein [Scandinavium sp. V105_1]
MLNKSVLFFIFTGCLVFPAGYAMAAATVLQNCFTGPIAYNIEYQYELPTNENRTGSIVDHHDHQVGDLTTMEANCQCPRNLASGMRIDELSAAGSPLPPGISGYGSLTDRVDVDISGYSDAINSPGGNGLLELDINEYPTSPANRPTTRESFNSTEGTASVCSDESRPEGGATNKRQFRWNVISMKLYIKKPILGEEVIPQRTVVENFACLSFGTGTGCDSTNATQVSTISLGGTITAPLSCTINAGSTIEIEMGNIVSSQFIAQGQPPAGYTLKNVDIDYHCDAPAVSNSNKIRLSLTADQGVSDTDNRVIAKMLDRDDLGVRMFDENSKSVILDGTVDFDVPLDSDGNGSIHLKAAPVSTTNKKPEPGKFEGNVTIKMDLR